jgi:CheY-like chemotaxis protein
MTDSLPILTIAGTWQALLQPPRRAALEAALPAYIQPRRWFGGKARGIASAQLLDTIPIAYGAEQAIIAMVRVSYGEGPPDTYVLPLACATGAHADQLAHDLPHAVIAHIQRTGGERGVLYDALLDRGFCAALLELSGHHVQTAYTGRHALELAETFRPHAMLLDIGLPDFDGYELATKVRRAPWGRGITLIAADGKKHVIARGDLDELASTGKSVMPEGLEKDINVSEMSDLLAFLRQSARSKEG